MGGRARERERRENIGRGGRAKIPDAATAAGTGIDKIVIMRSKFAGYQI